MTTHKVMKTNKHEYPAAYQDILLIQVYKKTILIQIYHIYQRTLFLIKYINHIEYAEFFNPLD